MGPVLLSTVANWAAWHHLYIVLFHAMHEERVQHRFPDAAGWLDKVPHVFINPSLVDWKGWQIHNGFSGSSIHRASACFLPIAEDITRASPVDNLINVGDVDTQTECYCCYNAAQLRTFGGKVTTFVPDSLSPLMRGTFRSVYFPHCKTALVLEHGRTRRGFRWAMCRVQQRGRFVWKNNT